MQAKFTLSPEFFEIKEGNAAAEVNRAAFFRKVLREDSCT
jgi:hypothetical protein